MEKFGTWADQATGIRPFIPLSIKISGFQKFMRYFFGFLKLVLLLSTLLNYLIFITVISFLPIPIIRRFLIRVYSYVIGHLYLLLFGSPSTSVECKPLINKRFEPESWEGANSGDIIISPLTSYLDILWLETKLSPVFAIPVDETHVVVYTFYKLIFSILNHRNLRSGNCQEIQNVVEKARRSKLGPVVIFPESAPSNGLGILKFIPLNFAVSPETRILLLAFHNTGDGNTPNFVCQKPFPHLIQMAGRLYAPIQAFAPLHNYIEPLQPSKFNNKVTPELLENIREVLGKLLNIPLLQIGANECRGFLDAYLSESGDHLKED